MMIDCHTHLTDPVFSADREAVLSRAKAAGITHVAIVGQDREENDGVLSAAAERPQVYLPFLGLHPDRFADRREPVSEEEHAAILDQIRRNAAGLTGIGEVGLDYWVCQTPERQEAQRVAFTDLVRLSLELDLPLNVHSRSAGRHTVDLLLNLGARRVLMHAFDGKASHALRGAEAGFIFSIPPSILRSPQKQKLVRALPLESLALETDSPVLGPEQGVRNEPANAALSLAAIAQIKGVAQEHAAAVLLATTRRLLGLPES
ncbi:MAG: TatD family hydrolase [Deltaproteobacteria bacterium]|nr:TatD family hydrolase [Deltaproteobacteria bacterium]